MKLDLPTPGVPVSPTRSAGRARPGRAREQRPRRGAVVGRGSNSTSVIARASARRSPAASRAGRAPPLAHAARHASFIAVARLASGACLAYPAAGFPRHVAPRSRADASRPVPLVGLALGARSRPAPPPPSSELRLLRRRHPRRRDELASEQSGGRYAATSRIDTAGLVGIFADFFFDGKATGRLDGDGTVVPGAASRRTSKSPRADAHDRIDWEGGTPVSVSVEPPRERAPDPAKQARDARPGLRRLRGCCATRRPEAVCDTTVDVFDGSRRSRLQLGDAGGAGDALICAGTFARIEGEAHSMSDQREFPFKLVFAPAGGGARPARARSRRRRTSARRCSSAAPERDRPAAGAADRAAAAARSGRGARAAQGRAVLQAPPGAGKTTRVPLTLLERAWSPGAS